MTTATTRTTARARRSRCTSRPTSNKRFVEGWVPGRAHPSTITATQPHTPPPSQEQLPMDTQLPTTAPRRTTIVVVVIAALVVLTGSVVAISAVFAAPTTPTPN